LHKLRHTDIKHIRDSLLPIQDYKCGVCKGDFRDAKLVGKKLVPILTATLDHDHDTGYIRGVLCNNCNGNEGRIRRRAISSARGQPYLRWLEELVLYLQVHEQPQTPWIHPTHKNEDEKRLHKNKKARQRRAAAKAKAILAGIK